MKKFLAVTLVAIMVLTAMMLVACAPDISAVKTKLEDEGYAVMADTSSKDDIEGATCVLFATKLISTMMIYECESYFAAKDAVEEANENAIFKLLEVKQMGNMIVIGSEQAFEDAGL